MLFITYVGSVSIERFMITFYDKKPKVNFYHVTMQVSLTVKYIYTNGRFHP